MGGMNKMPNYCDCDLRISGNAKDLKEFEEFAKSDRKFLDYEDERMSEIDEDAYHSEIKIIDFNKFIPSPRYQKFMFERELNKIKDKSEKKSKLFAYHISNNDEELKKYNLGDGWYDWNCRNWATKWNLNGDNISFKRLSKSIFYNFLTAWNPPMPVIYAMSEKFPKLKFNLKYYEQGAGFKGELGLKNREVIINKEDKDYRGGRGG